MACNWCLPFCYFSFLEPHHHHKACNHPIISKLIHHFYLQCPPSCKPFDPLDVKHLLSLLESWAPVSSLILNLLGRLLLILDLLLQSIILIKICSALIMSTSFFCPMLLISFPHLVARWTDHIITSSYSY